MDEKQYNELIEWFVATKKNIDSTFWNLCILVFGVIIMIFFMYIFGITGLFNTQSEEIQKLSKQIEQLSNVSNKTPSNFIDLKKQFNDSKNGTLLKSVIESTKTYDEALQGFQLSKTERDSSNMKISFQKMLQYASTYSELQKLREPEFKQFLDSAIQKQIQEKLSKMKL